jgi:hypothetical protein
MRRLIVAGLVYLTGIAVILVIKPQYMFREDGRWKEFGIGRDPANFTHVPFWLFAIIWAIVSYATISILEDTLYGHTYPSSQPCAPCEAANPTVAPLNNQRNSRNSRNTKATQNELVPGYYMLNEGATGRNGVPRYVYLGPEEPEF